MDDTGFRAVVEFQPQLSHLKYAEHMVRFCLITATLLVSACDGSIYVRDGVTDGDTFYLAEQAWTNDDPVLQSWVTYSLAKSTCQLEIGGDNPARNTSYGCEYTARRLLLDTWDEKRAADVELGDDYLDTLATVHDAGYLDEYVVFYFRRRHWQVPVEVELGGFRQWRGRNLRGHRASTRIIGSWNYKNKP